jgi:heat shock protein beta
LVVGSCIPSARADDDDASEGDAASEGAPSSSSSTPVVSQFTAEEEAAIAKNQEQFDFQADVARMMDIIIHSLYKDREIFMRELISNAADALDKIRFLSLTNKEVLGTGLQAELDIRIKFDKDAKTITLTDRGIGMTKEGLIKYLGVVASSGTTEFLQKMTSAQDMTLIGQFGVGFYSVYLVSDRVTVASKHNDDPIQHVWQSTANHTFTVAPDPRGNTLLRGTEITLHLKEDATEFLSESRLETLVTKYSQFINFPIYLWSTRDVEKEVPDESAVEEEEEEAVDLDKKEGEEAAETDGADDKKKEPKTKKVRETIHEWKRLNTAKAIWTRSPSDVTEDEYNEFYKTLVKDDNEPPITKIHFSAEGEIAFKSILYIPSKAESGLYDKYYEKSTALKLYVRRVLISDEFDDFLPRYLNFVRGVVDSEDLPLNVSRETLAQSKVLKVIAKKLTRKVLDMVTRLARGTDDDKEDDEEEGDKKDEKKDENEKYLKFWESFGKSLKLGVIDDRSNRAKLAKLLRFVTSKSEGKLISLQTYVDRMKENQKSIYFITGVDLKTVENSPFIERLKKRDLEVVFMTDPLDEYLTSALTEFDGNTLQSVMKEGLKLPGDKDLKELKEEFAPLSKYLQDVYGDRVTAVTVSNRLTDSPAIISVGQYGWSSTMERINKMQTFGDGSRAQYMMSKKTLEINPRHPIIKELKVKSAESPNDPALKDLANLMYDAALLQSGFDMVSPNEFASRIHRVMALGLDVDPNAKADVEVEDSTDDASDDAADAPADAEHGAGGHDEL